MNEILNIKEAIANLKMSITKADRSFDDYVLTGDEWYSPDWQIERCFFQLLAVSEAMGLMELHKMILLEYSAARDSNEKFLAASKTPDGEPYSLIISRIRQFLHAIQQFYPTKETATITKDVLQILRDIHYTITDKALFLRVPKDEKDVHVRIEGILKCVFPDLKHKPVLTKAIKNFEPDTGIPSIKTLIEYKFLSRVEDIPLIADQVLADTRGYVSKEWSRFIYLIYETNRFRSEKQWIQLMRQSEVPETTTIVVLSGEPSKRGNKKNTTRKKTVAGQE